MRAFITGASGFIGRSLARVFSQRKWDVRVLQHTQQLGRDSMPERDYDIVEGDITNPASLEGLFREVDILFHCAAALGASILSENDFFRINAEGTKNVLKASKEAGVPKIVHFSSAGVLGSVEAGEVAGEDHDPNPQNSYDRSKLEGERIARRFAEEGMDITIVTTARDNEGGRRLLKLMGLPFETN